MAKRIGARLAEGTSLIDYASAARILAAFDNDMKAIRAEYSRQRSIIRKRVERMEKAGETFNPYYQRYGVNRTKALPTVKSLSDRDLLNMLSSTARGIAGGYQSTLSEIKASRADITEALRMQAEEEGDEETAGKLAKGLSAKQMSQVGRIMGMIQRVVGKSLDSNTILQNALNVVLNPNKGESLLSKAARTIDLLGIDEVNGVDALEKLKAIHTQKGTTRVSWKRAQKRRNA